MSSFPPIALLLALSVAVGLQAASPPGELAAVIDEAWQFELRESPEFATRAGVHKYNDRLDEVSLAAEQRRAEARRGFLDRLEAIDAAELPNEDRVNHAILARDLRNKLAEYRYKTHLTPINGRSGFHISFPDLPKNVPLESTKDYENYIARLRAFSEQTAGNIELMREGLREGVTQPAVILEGWQDSVESHIVDDPTTSLLYEPLREFPVGVPRAEQERLREEARAAIAESVVPAYERFLRFMQTEYVPGARTNIGASALPDGREFYRYRIKKFTTLDMTPEEVHRNGLSEVARIRAEMMAIIKQVEFDGDFAAFVEHLRSSPQFYAKTPEALQEKTAIICKRMDGKLPKLFGRLPRTPYGLREVPAYIAPKTTSAYYMPPSGGGATAGYYYINTYNLPSRPLYSLEALSLHEAVPGHHLQLALQQELEGLPEFRKYSGFTAFIEGWALYSERLGLEVGFYEDPYSDFGRLTMEMWRACRLVVDTGIHYFGWTREQAIDFMKENSAMSEHNIRAEIDRYIGWPGQALAYKIGEMAIRDLRAMAEKKLGDAFDVRAFHDVVLGSGAVPLDVLKENVKAWVEETRP